VTLQQSNNVSYPTIQEVVSEIICQFVTHYNKREPSTILPEKFLRKVIWRVRTLSVGAVVCIENFSGSKNCKFRVLETFQDQRTASSRYLKNSKSKSNKCEFHIIRQKPQRIARFHERTHIFLGSYLTF